MASETRARRPRSGDSRVADAWRPSRGANQHVMAHAIADEGESAVRTQLQGLMAPERVSLVLHDLAEFSLARAPHLPLVVADPGAPRQPECVRRLLRGAR